LPIVPAITALRFSALVAVASVAAVMAPSVRRSRFD
jgi:hypothetical protein